MFEYVIDALVGRLKQYFDAVWGWIADSIGYFYVYIKQCISFVLSWISDTVYQVLEWIYEHTFLAFVDWLHDCFLYFINLFVDTFRPVFEFFRMVQNVVNAVWQFILFLQDCWNWCEKFFTNIWDFCYEVYDWVIVRHDEFIERLWETVQKALKRFFDSFYQCWEEGQNFIFENGKWLYNWFLENVDKAVGYFVDLIGSIFNMPGIQVSIPGRALNAVSEFMRRGMFFDSFLPVHETFQLMGIFLVFIVMMPLVRFVRSLIPFFH